MKNKTSKPVKTVATTKRCSYFPGSLIPVKIVCDDDIFLPKYKTKGDACCDLVANIPMNPTTNDQSISLKPKQQIKVDCGIKIAVPEGWEAQIRSRSGLASRGVQVSNGIGTIDSGYRGKVCVLLNNFGNEIVVLKHGERIAQMAIKPTYEFDWEVVDALDETERNEGGFGSTGLGN